MRFGIYTDVQCPPISRMTNSTGRFCGRLEHAEEMGFDVYSTIDHHFSQEFGISANPLALFCAAAQHTRRIVSARRCMSCRRKIRWKLAGPDRRR